MIVQMEFNHGKILFIICSFVIFLVTCSECLRFVEGATQHAEDLIAIDRVQCLFIPPEPPPVLVNFCVGETFC